MPLGSTSDVPQEKGEWVGKAELRERGWTPAMIARLLGEPDLKVRNPYYRAGFPMRLFRRARVDLLETTPEFATLRSIGAAHSERAKAAAARRADQLLETARAYQPKLPERMDYHRLVRSAIQHYNDENEHRGKFAELGSDVTFLARIAWNHFRHHLTDWDTTWEGFARKPGVRRAYVAAATSLAAHVCDAFPELQQAAQAWLERKRTSDTRP